MFWRFKRNSAMLVKSNFPRYMLLSEKSPSQLAKVPLSQGRNPPFALENSPFCPWKLPLSDFPAFDKPRSHTGFSPFSSPSSISLVSLKFLCRQFPAVRTGRLTNHPSGAKGKPPSRTGAGNERVCRRGVYGNTKSAFLPAERRAFRGNRITPSK